MAAPSFERAVAHVFLSEGGYSDHPSDPGGATNMGITIATLGMARGRKVTKADVKALTREEAKGLYRKFYWDRVRGDALPVGVDLAVFDFAVNSGPVRGVKALQTVLGVASDGVIGPKTIAAVNKADPAETIRKLTKDRLNFLSKLPSWPVFGRGWRKRVLSVETEALAMLGRADVVLHPIPDAEPVAPKVNWFASLLFAFAALFKRKAA